jgi:hypothetical protein
LSWFLDSRLPQVFAINLSIENFLVSGSYCQSNKEGVFVKSLSCIASGILLNPNSGYLAMPICSKCGLGFNLSSALSQKRW